MNSRDKEIQSVSTGNICLTSNPCQHYVTVKYNDGTVEKKGKLSADEIVKQYGKYLRNLSHFTHSEERVECIDDGIECSL